MKKLRRYHEVHNVNEWIEGFQYMLYGSEMTYLASDLIKEGISVSDLESAIKGAIISTRSAGIETRKHFMPIYTDIDGTVVRDCKTTQLGLAMILLNGNPKVGMVANWQLKLVRHFLTTAN